MLDIGIYRQNESLAKKEMSKWQIRSRHNLDLFEKAGFPVRVENNQQLRSLIDTMNENGFEHYQNNINGLSEEEVENFVTACAKAVEFSLELFPTEKPILPIHNLAQAFVFYTIINKLKNYESILEIGPGSGALAYFMSQKKNLKLYAQAEACESFYILQSHLNRFLFKREFYESVFLKPEFKAADFWTISAPDSYQPPIELDVEMAEHKAAHYPWWRLGELASSEQKFDIIASNANLLEFSRAALLDYLPLIQKKLKDDGLFVFHCTGGHHGGTPETLYKDLYSLGFAPLFLDSGSVKGIGEIDSSIKRVIIAPAGNFALRPLLQNKEFTSRFEEIILVDDHKAGQEMEGYKIISREGLSDTDIQDVIVFSDHNRIVEDFSRYFRSKNKRILDFRALHLGRALGVLVGKNHPLFEKYHYEHNFVSHFDSGEQIVKGVVDFEFKTYYTRDDIVEKTLKKLASKA